MIVKVTNVHEINFGVHKTFGVHKFFRLRRKKFYLVYLFITIKYNIEAIYSPDNLYKFLFFNKNDHFCAFLTNTFNFIKSIMLNLFSCKSLTKNLFKVNLKDYICKRLVHNLRLNSIKSSSLSFVLQLNLLSWTWNKLYPGVWLDNRKVYSSTRSKNQLF